MLRHERYQAPPLMLMLLMAHIFAVAAAATPASATLLAAAAAAISLPLIDATRDAMSLLLMSSAADMTPYHAGDYDSCRCHIFAICRAPLIIAIATMPLYFFFAAAACRR